VADDAQASDTVRNHCCIRGEQPDDCFRKNYEYNSDCAQEHHVVTSGQPDGLLGSIRFIRAEILPDKGSRGAAQSPGREDHKDDDPYPYRVARDCNTPECADDADENHPARLADGILEHSVDCHAQKALQDVPMDAELCGCESDPAVTAEKNPHLKNDP